MTLWCMAKSPIMFGGDLRNLDKWTHDLITNPTLLGINSFSSNNMEACHDNTLLFLICCFLFWQSYIICSLNLRFVMFLLFLQFPHITRLNNVKNDQGRYNNGIRSWIATGKKSGLMLTILTSYVKTIHINGKLMRN